MVLLALLGACSRAAVSGPVTQALTVRTASFRASVADLSAAEARLRRSVETLGGVTTSSERTGVEGDGRLTVVFRVPTAKLTDALAELEGLATHVDSRQVRGEDFTEEYVDLEAQRGNLIATRDRLSALLQQAKTVGDALEVNRGLSEVQGQLDRLTGRTTFLTQAAAFATVTATFWAEPPIAFGWQPLEVARSALQALLVVLQGLGNLLIVVAVFAPLWAPVLWLLRRRRATA